MLPATFGEVDATWLTHALVEGGLDVVVAEALVEPMDPSKGLIGDLAVVHLTYERGDGPPSVVLKLPAASPDSRRIGEMLNSYGREVAFYRHVAPASEGARVPRCFFAGEDLATRRWAILIEHIEPDPFDFLAGATAAQASAAVDALADFHAQWWESERPFDWMPGFDASGVGGLQPLWLENLPVFTTRYAESLPGPTADWVLRFAPQLSTWSAEAALDPLTMVHSDYRLDNLLFVDGEVTMIDWQTAMRAPAAMDLSCFLTTSLAIDDRRHDEDAYIDRYLNRLAAAGVAVDPRWFRQSYDENVLWWMGQFGNNLAHLEPPDPRVVEALRVMAERVYSAGLDRDVGRLL